MKKLALSLPLVAIASFLCMEAIAQNDSVWLDAGTLKLRRDLTQTISIKGTDLEKMPFTNLSDAIQAWLYGAYAGPNSLQYVVDGIPLGDVNAYSIYDIDEVVLVQNALMQVNGVAQQQQLVLITTRKKSGGGMGITVAAQTGLVNSYLFSNSNNGKPLHSYSNFYHQYYIGINKDWKNIRYGISASYQRDPFPSTKGDSIQVFTPDHLNRWHLNGYMAIGLDNKNELTLRMNYTPENSGDAEMFTYPSHNESNSELASGHQYIFNPSATWTSALGRGWKNQLQAAWLTTTEKSNELIGSSVPDTTLPPYPSGNSMSAFAANQHTEHLFIRDHLSYTLQTGGWNFVSSLNAGYEHINYSMRQSEESAYFGGFTISSEFRSQKTTLYLLTPSVDAQYKGVLDLQAGLLYNLSKNDFSESVPRVFPFVSASTEVLGWRQKKNGSSLKLFASASKSPDLTTRDYALTDYSNMGTPLAPVVSFSSYTLPGGGGLPPTTLAISSGTPSNWAWEAGAIYSTAGHRLEISYHFVRSKNMNYVEIPIPAGGNGSSVLYVDEVFHFTTQRLGIMARLMDNKVFQWRSGLNISGIQAKADLNAFDIVENGIVGDISPAHPSWTGGWVNRLSYKALSLGLDMLYHFNEEKNFYTGLFPPPPISKTNSLMLQQVYLSYHLRVSGVQGLEIYLDTRNLFDSNGSDLGDGRRYFGIGGKMGI